MVGPLADQEVVIVGDDGTEHVFPPGFDPVKAAGIVRQGASPSLLQRVGNAIRHPMTSVVPSLAARDDAPVTLGDLRANPMEALRRLGHIIGKDATTPALAAGAAAPFVLPGGMRAVAKMPIREPIATGLDIAGGAVNNPVVGAMNPALPHVGRMLTAVGRVVRPKAAIPDANAAPNIPGFERYPRPETTPPSTAAPSAARQADMVDEQGATPTDPRDPAVLPYAGPERRQVTQTPDDLNYGRQLDRLGGRADLPTSDAADLASRLGTPGDAEMAMAVSQRNATGSWRPTAPPSSLPSPLDIFQSRPSGALNQAMDAAVSQAVRRKLQRAAK